jgi:23S rRNA G2445 N2-methylase RlmL
MSSQLGEGGKLRPWRETQSRAHLRSKLSCEILLLLEGFK